jgi:hypothetical protein
MAMYFAYSANMDEDRLRSRSGQSAVRFLCAASLANYQLRFSHRPEMKGGAVADILPQDGSMVWGVLFEFPDAGLTALDKAETEGLAPPLYKRVPVKVTARPRDTTPVFTGNNTQIKDGTEIDAQAHQFVQRQERPVLVDEDYRKLLIAAAAKRDLPADFIQLLLERSTRPAATLSVSDIHVGARDAAENEVVTIYSKVPSKYAVYRASDRATSKTRVVIQFADDSEVAAQQRQKIAPLNAKRSEIAGLLSNWSDSHFDTFRDKARSYEARVAAALVYCLEGDPDGALASLNDVSKDILDERTSWGRFEYLQAAAATAIVSILLLGWIKSALQIASAGSLWLAARAGAVGAFFSVAIALRNRTVLPNTRRKDNITDATLRIVIGVIAASVLTLVLQADIIPSFKVGGATLSGVGIAWQAVLVIGFLAGFSERLVPDLLAKATTTPTTGAQIAVSGP